MGAGGEPFQSEVAERCRGRPSQFEKDIETHTGAAQLKVACQAMGFSHSRAPQAASVMVRAGG